ncbi:MULTISPECIES: hypothetical protein [Ruminococcus]|uniref:Ferredoxin-dependent bilin reductase n=1 Tax=Ruminococcus flavefaciens TaxID=1265 RepID=A0A1M7IPZ6_RUMFL|nr:MULTISPECIES: hypothetical protein [Ruminococcus]MCR4794135.1 hypothetical protein [Ruminococcus sp.]SHM42894.1 Ferredoxin-dependent bilin reductase [Ruminococcus flavefaciens]
MKNSEVKKKKRWPKVLLVIFIIIGAVIGFVCYNASKNMKVMNRTLDAGMDTISEYAKLTPVDPGEYKQIKMYGLLKFDVEQYDVEDIGNLSVMKVNMGFMQMVSYIITPYKKNMPMLSMDFMYILGKRKAYAEFYDLVSDTDSSEYEGVIEKIKGFESSYSDMEDIKTDPAWYDKYLTVVLHKAAKRDDDEKVEKMFCDAIRCYMEAAKELKPLSDAEKINKLAITQEYCDNLVDKGGVSTDVFKKQLGKDKTKDFFDKVLFGTEQYR